jgi:hypothetical protein
MLLKRFFKLESKDTSCHLLQRRIVFHHLRIKSLSLFFLLLLSLHLAKKEELRKKPWRRREVE